MPHLVLLWTDALVWLLFATVMGFIAMAHRQPHLAAPWYQVLCSPLGMGTGVILSAYLMIGLLDSLHVRFSENSSGYHPHEIVSVFDLLAGPLRTQKEKTYSAPLATHLFTKETLDHSNGGSLRDYPRLRYGGAHLADPIQDWGWDVTQRILRGLAVGLLLWGMIITAFLYRFSHTHISEYARRIWKGQTPIPWRVLFGVLGGLLLIAGVAISLASGYHLFGTDKVGEDVFYQTLKSIRTGLVIGTLTTLIMLPAALLLGIMAGYFRGWVDDVIQYLYTTLSSIPGVLLIAAAILMLQLYMGRHEAEFISLIERADLRLLFLCLILGVTSWTGLCRLLRGETLKLRELDYVLAAQALGVAPFTLLQRHIIPNVLHIVLITIVLDFSGLVLAEAVLSYVNIGVDPTMNSWGNMINSARLELAREPLVWWSLTAAFIFMFILVLAANLFSDVVRDALDPRLTAPPVAK